MASYEVSFADMDDPGSIGWDQGATPDPRTPCLSTSACADGFETTGSIFTSGSTGVTALTLPDEFAECDINVKGVAVENPFGLGSFGRDNLIAANQVFSTENLSSPSPLSQHQEVDTDEDSLFNGDVDFDFVVDSLEGMEENSAQEDQSDDASYKESTEEGEDDADDDEMDGFGSNVAGIYDELNEEDVAQEEHSVEEEDISEKVDFVEGDVVEDEEGLLNEDEAMDEDRTRDEEEVIEEEVDLIESISENSVAEIDNHQTATAITATKYVGQAQVGEQAYGDDHDDQEHGTIDHQDNENEDTVMSAANFDANFIDPEMTSLTEPDVANSDTSSDWGEYGEVTQKLEEYETTKQLILGQEKWTKAQAKLHKLLSLRGVWPMFDRTWFYHFKDRAIYPSVYAPEHSKRRVAITAKSHDFKGMLLSVLN